MVPAGGGFGLRHCSAFVLWDGGHIKRAEGFQAGNDKAAVAYARKLSTELVVEVCGVMAGACAAVTTPEAQFQ
jgi:hypothetical protein